jgi:hypothetical protein
MVMAMMAPVFSGLCERRCGEPSALRCLPSDSDPPEPATVLLGYLALLLHQLLPQLSPPFILLLPELGAIVVPIASELRRK